MSKLKVREDWLTQHGKRYPVWTLLMITFIHTNAYAVIPAKYGWKDGDVEDSDILIYQKGVKGPPAAFRVNGSHMIECVNYPVSIKPMSIDQFIDYVDGVMHTDPDDIELAKILAK